MASRRLCLLLVVIYAMPIFQIMDIHAHVYVNKVAQRREYFVGKQRNYFRWFMSSHLASSLKPKMYEGKILQGVAFLSVLPFPSTILSSILGIGQLPDRQCARDKILDRQKFSCLFVVLLKECTLRRIIVKSAFGTMINGGYGATHQAKGPCISKYP